MTANSAQSESSLRCLFARNGRVVIWVDLQLRMTELALAPNGAVLATKTPVVLR